MELQKYLEEKGDKKDSGPYVITDSFLLGGRPVADKEKKENTSRRFSCLLIRKEKEQSVSGPRHCPSLYGEGELGKWLPLGLL